MKKRTVREYLSFNHNRAHPLFEDAAALTLGTRRRPCHLLFLDAAYSHHSYLVDCKDSKESKEFKESKELREQENLECSSNIKETAQ